ncbi:hypothetical protein BH23ACT4_BH23ACT4_13500 [soil metagenome]
MKQKLVAATVAGGLLVGAGFATAVISNPGIASAQGDSPESTEETNVGPFKNHDSVLEDVLSDLVEEGTIDQGQADAIVEALDAKTAELRTATQDVRGLIARLLEDGVLTDEELAQLPDVFPFNDLERIFGEALDDGELTLEEFQEAVPQPKGSPFWSGARFGALLGDGGIDQEEYDSLADDHPLKQVDMSEYLADGIITIDELRELKKSQSDSGDAA